MRNVPGKSAPPPLAYVERINRAVDFVLQHWDETLRLDAVARAAGFSPFHFHRVFSVLMGESLNTFVKRVRLERALKLMSQKDWSTRRSPSLTDIAFSCGFESPADFSRCFKQQYGVPPSRFDVDAFRATRRDDWQTAVAGPAQRHLLDGLPPGQNPDGFAVTFRPLPPRIVAYIRIANSYREGVVPAAADRLMAWAEAHGCADRQWLGYAWDDPEIVDVEKCRYDVGVEVDDVTPTGEIGRFEFPAMRVAELEIRGGIDLEMRALDWLFATWLPTSGYVPTDQPCFEAWIGRPFAHGQEHFELRLQLPVERG
ncbi:AraC family transcriptional regulator [Synoicihabitans lomoniglobus]|uniref:AraC family transcriptional regulator n=1 Tax=Synoicihabitans lomoniglobus TaxID=2909285 RepID=A0AAE9ZW68_9BACT|nr:AraC family transcriptional regulator [Opitutaceae bacterium LMO-M01]WED63623.1 AraC family transcriptional regulator [Opitutaceae bacterium LMO-M01]